MKPIRALLVDDHSLFREGVAALLRQRKEFAVVGEAQDGIEAVARAKALKPDLVLMDISMPRCDGVEAARRICQALPAVKVVMLTILEQDRKVFEAIKAGAQGYILKNVKPDALFHALLGVMSGEAAISRVTASKILDEFAGRSGFGAGASCQEDLSERELSVLKLITQGKTNKEIAQTLNLAENTVKNHLKNILDKLQVANRVQAATLALEKGIVSK